MATKKVIFFTAGITPTSGELALIAKLNAAAIPAYSVHVLNSLANFSYGAGIAFASFVAGSIPAAYSSYTVINPLSIPPQTTTRRVLFFTAGPLTTIQEQSSIDLLNAATIPAYQTVVMNGAANASYGEGRIAPSDYVAGTIPTAFSAVPVIDPNTLTPSAPTVPDAPTIGVASAGNGTISVPYSPPANNGGASITSYEATLSTGTVLTGSQNPFVFTGLNNGTSYTVTIKAINSVGKSVASSASNSVTPSAGITVPAAPTIGTIVASYNDVQGNILTVPFTANSNGGSAITSYTVTLSTGETATGSASPIVFVNNLTNGVARTATVKATNAIGQGAASSASNSATPVAKIRVATVESRGCTSKETQGKTGIIGRRSHITGSAPLKDIGILMNGWIEASSVGYFALENAFTISEMSVCAVGGTPAIMTFGGNASVTVNPGDTEIPSDFVLAAAILGGGATEIPRGTELFFKFKITLPTTAGLMMFTPTTLTDSSGTQYAFYDPAATTITNSAAVDGIYTFTGTTPAARGSGWSPIVVGHYVTGDPKTAIGFGDSIMQNVGDTTPKKTGRGWLNNLMVDAGAITNPYSCINFGCSGDTAGHQAANAKMLAYSKYARIGFESLGTNDISLAGTGNPTTIRASCATVWAAMKSNSAGGAMPIFRTYIQPESTPTNPTKTYNSAPNTNWGVGEKSKQLNDLFAADLQAGNIQYFVDPVSARQSSNNTQVEYFLWKYKTGGTNVYDTDMTTDGVHPANAGVLVFCSDYRPTWNAIN